MNTTKFCVDVISQSHLFKGEEAEKGDGILPSLSGFLWSDGLGISSPFSPPVEKKGSPRKTYNRFR